jgi:hypothetical protein
MITTEHDSLMTQHGLPSAVDTVDVCEDWTGTDYVYQAVTAGSSENIPGFTDTVQTIMYQGGYVTGYSATGELAAEPNSVGPTAFDFLYADNATRQASYDDPYYGVGSSDPCPPVCPEMAANSSLSQEPARARTVRAGSGDTTEIEPPRFVRHSLSRRGVRALVDDAVELSLSSEGYRRFRTISGEKTTVRSVHPVTQLLMVEEFSEPQGSMRVTHAWSRVSRGYVRNHTDYSNVERIDGRELRSWGRIVFQNVRVSNPRFPTLGVKEATP